MCKIPRYCPSLLVACLLLCGSLVMAQEDNSRHTSTATADHGDSHAAEGHDFTREDPYDKYRQRESFLMWMIRCMGPIGLLIPVAGLCSFALTLVVVIRGKGPFAFAALVFLVPIPFLLGLFGTIQGMILSLVIATSTVAPKPSEISDGIATSLFNPMLGLVFMTPSYLAATIGAIFRSCAKPDAN